MGSESDIPNFITIDKNDLLHPKLPESLSIEFCRSAVHAGLQTPINGVVQLGDKLCGTKILPHVQFVDGCHHAEFMSTRWHTQQFGVLFGTAINLLVLQKCVGKAGDAIFGHIENTPAHQFQMATRSVQEAAVTGFLHNALFRPTGRDEGEFYTARLRNGAIGAGTWATLQAGALGIKHMGRAQDNMFGSFLRSEMGSTVLSGVPGGIVQAELKSLLNGNGFADRNMLAECVYTQSILGGIWAGGKEVIGGTTSDTNLSTHMKTASLIARGKELPAPNLLEPTLPITAAPFRLPNPPIMSKTTPRG